MAINGYALVSDLKENKLVLRGSCETFKVGDSVDFTNKLNKLISDKYLDRSKTFEIVKNNYNWDKITEKYCDLIFN